MKKILQEEKQDWIKRYLNGESARQISKDYPQYNENSISRVIRSAGISRGKGYKKESSENELNILNDYKKELPISNIAKKYSICERTVSKILKKHSIVLKHGKKSSCVESYFEKIDNPHKAYLLGFITADGSIIGKYNSSCAIEIHKKDSGILYFAKNQINPNATITECFSNEKHNLRINFSSKKMCDDLQKYGVIPNKSKTIEKVPINLIPKDLFCFYIRGLIDGDGCILKNGGINIYSGSYIFIKNIQECLVDLIGVSKNKIYHGTTYFVSWNSKSDKEKIFNFLYKEKLNDTYYFERKYLRLYNFLYGNTELTY